MTYRYQRRWQKKGQTADTTCSRPPVGIILNFRPEDPLIQSPAETQAIQAIWAPDRTMASRIRFVLAHCFAHHIRPGLPPTRTGLQLGDAASMRRKFSHYTGQILADLGADMGDPASYREKQILTRVSLLMAGDVSCLQPLSPNSILPSSCPPTRPDQSSAISLL